MLKILIARRSEAHFASDRVISDYFPLYYSPAIPITYSLSLSSFNMLLFSHLILSLVALTELTGAAKILSRQQQAPGTPLFLDEPSCDSYQCAVTFKPGDNATAHWLNAPAGNVVLVMSESTLNW